MKKLQILLVIFAVGVNSLWANPVIPSTAKTVAQGFYAQRSTITSPAFNLAYTETAGGQAVYYVFNVNTNDGFVIVSAEDATHPILGYSTTGQYVVPVKGNNIDFWMQKKKNQILSIRSNNYSASPDIADEWTSYANNSAPQHSAKRFSSIMSVAPLCQTTWNQSPYYNAYCPGGSVTGCVATAMAQIMKYWNYPAHGISQSCYEDLVSMGDQMNYGELCAEYDTSNYAWSNMPLNLSSNNNEVAKLMYDAGVSVDMDYSPSGSGAQVLGGNPSAQYSYPTYFGYNASTIKGAYKSSYSVANWVSLIENELNSSRPVQYAGFDTNGAGGHTWVCDGYDALNDFHMNWGWGGADNGYYNVDSLNPNPYVFLDNDQVLYGIEPPPALALFTATPTSGCGSLNVTFTDQSLVSTPTAPITNWQWTFTGGNPATSIAQNPTVLYNTQGTYAVKLKVKNILGSDSLTKTGYITVNGSNALALVQGFEGAFPPSQWAINNPNGHNATWEQYNGVGGFGGSSHCMYYNNCAFGVVGQYDQIYTPEYDFTNIVNPVLYFDVAYTPYNVSTSPPESDTLAVYYSTDCGQTFTRIYLKGGMTLCTNGGTQQYNINPNACFIPTGAEWRTDTVHIPAIAGNSGVLFSFENRSGNGTNLFVDNINIPGIPVTAFKVNDSIICLNNIDSVQFLDQSTNTPNSWNWTFPGGTPSTSTKQNPWVTYSTAGLYTGKLKTSNSNGSDSLTKTNYVIVNTCTGIQNISTNNSMTLYPNPAKDEFTVQLGGTTKAQLIVLYNITGQVVLSVKPAAGQTLIINTKDVANGVYLLKVQTEDGSTMVSRVEIMK